MKNLLRLCAGILVVLVFGVLPAEAYVRINVGGKNLKWNSWPISWRISNYAPIGFSDNSWKIAIRKAFESWEDLPDSKIKFNEKPQTTSKNINNSSTHLVYFDRNNSTGILNSNSLVAVTWISYTPSNGNITDADIVFNDNSINSFTFSGEPGKYDIMDIMTHEIGHFIGLDHSPVLPGTMWPYVNTSQTFHRSLSHDDAGGARAVRSSGASASLSGVVKKNDGSNAKGAVVVAVSAMDGRTRGSCVSKKTGTWSIDGLPAEALYIYATPLDGYMTSANMTGDATVQTDFGSTFYGGWPSPSFFTATTNGFDCGTLTLDPDRSLRDRAGAPRQLRPGMSTVMTVSGSGFTTGAMNATAMAPSSVLSVGAVSSFSTTMTVSVSVSPAAPLGMYDLFLTNSAGDVEPVIGAIEIVAVAPVLTSITGGTGASAGGESVTLQGSGFQDGAFVMFGGKEAIVSSFDSATSLKVTTPSGAVGTVDVRVHNPDGQVVLVDDAWRYVDIPSVTRVFPSAGQASGGTKLSVEGANFDDQIEVSISGTPATSVLVESATRMLVTTPGGSLGDAIISVTNPSADPVDVNGAFSYVSAPDPLVSGFFPLTGESAGGEEVRISGLNLTSTASVRFGSASNGAAASAVTVENSASVVAVSPPQSPGSYPLEVVFSNGQGAIAAASFSVTEGSGSARKSAGGGGGGGGCGGLANSPDYSWLLVAGLFFLLTRRSRSQFQS